MKKPENFAELEKLLKGAYDALAAMRSDPTDVDKERVAHQKLREISTRESIVGMLALWRLYSREIGFLMAQLAGIHVAASGKATGVNDVTQDSYGWSPAFEEVKQLRRKYDELRENVH